MIGFTFEAPISESCKQDIKCSKYVFSMVCLFGKKVLYAYPQGKSITTWIKSYFYRSEGISDRYRALHNETQKRCEEFFWSTSAGETDLQTITSLNDNQNNIVYALFTSARTNLVRFEWSKTHLPSHSSDISRHLHIIADPPRFLFVLNEHVLGYNFIENGGNNGKLYELDIKTTTISVRD